MTVMEAPLTSHAGIYVHVPFCTRVCPYCDFAVRTGGPQARDRYVRALLTEIEARPEGPGTVDTVYLGGGTPSVLDPDSLGRILEAVGTRWRLHPDTWVSLEANPEDIAPERLRAWRDLGVRTVSLGVQSFVDAELRFLGREHDAATAVRAVQESLSAGFPIVSVDLIFGLPGQTAANWSEQLRRAAALSPQHISCYQLTVHEGTRFGRLRDRGTLQEMPDPEQAALFRLTHEVLGGRGYEGYEVSNFAAAPEHRSRHNSKYWRHLPYLGLGPSAHSFDGRRRRSWNRRTLADWAGALERSEDPREDEEDLDPTQLALEALLLGMRTRQGVDLAAIRDRTGLDLFRGNQERLQEWQRVGLVRLDGSRVLPTLDGLVIAESLVRDWEVPAPPGPTPD